MQVIKRDSLINRKQFNFVY